jgi:hypothetical protein
MGNRTHWSQHRLGYLHEKLPVLDIDDRILVTIDS